MKRLRLPSRTRNRIAFWALAGVALFVSHDAVYLAQLGPGEELTRTIRQAGHGYWGLASAVLALIGLTVSIGVWARFRRLRRRARAIRAGSAPLRRRPFLRGAAIAWLRMLAVVGIGFVIQENVEHLVIHGHAPGLGPLVGPEYPLAMPVIALISAVAGLIAAAIACLESELVATILAALRRRIPRPPQRLGRPPTRLAHRAISPLAGSHAGRAPPLLLVPA